MFGLFNDIWNNLPLVFNLLYLATVVIIAIIIVHENRNPLKTVSWILVLVLIPFIGIVFYLFFGQEYRRRKMYSRKGLKNLKRLRKLTQEQIKSLSNDQLEFSQAVSSKKNLINLMLSSSDALLTQNNEVSILKNGNEKFPALFQAMEEAKHHIHVEYYIIDDDELGWQMNEILCRKAKEGVEVRLIFDDVGSWSLSRKYQRTLREAGVKVGCFMEVRFPKFTSKVNYRNHRKIVVIDSEVAFTGGLNIADRYLHGTKKLQAWRDTHLMLKGSAATLMQVIFMGDWYFVSGEPLKGNKYFKTHEPNEGKMVQVVSSGPDSDYESIGQAYFSAIASAQEKIYITTPYLIPTSEIIFAMKTAALSGIDIRILLPSKSDTITPKWSTDSYITELLEAGIRVYKYQPGFIHSKTIVVDGVLSSIGSANMDFRSLETNFEVGALIYDEHVANEMEQHFMDDLQNSSELNLKEWQKRHWIHKTKESFARLFSPML